MATPHRPRLRSLSRVVDRQTYRLLVLVYVDGLTHADAARVVGLPRRRASELIRAALVDLRRVEGLVCDLD